MRRRKPATIQINVRLDGAVVDRLAARAKANRVTFSEESRQRLIDSLDPPGLSSVLANLVRNARDLLERGARRGDIEIESAWRSLQALEAKCAKFYADAETELLPYVSDPKIRELLRGAPALPDETKSKTAQQE